MYPKSQLVLTRPSFAFPRAIGGGGPIRARGKLAVHRRGRRLERRGSFHRPVPAPEQLGRAVTARKILSSRQSLDDGPVRKRPALRVSSVVRRISVHRIFDVLYPDPVAVAHSGLETGAGGLKSKPQTEFQI